MTKLKSITGFLPYMVVVFLNAFVDLGHKIVIQNTVFKSYSGQEQVVLTAVVNGLILIPFIMLFSPAGFLADRFAKHIIIRHSALAAVVATLAITFCYYQGWFWAAFALTLALAVQSAIYSPAKYGYIRELVGTENLATANGAVQAVTIGGILLGTVVFSLLFESLLAATAPGSADEIVARIASIGWLLVALALMEWLISRRLPARHKGNRGNTFELKSYVQFTYLRKNLQVINANTAIKLSIIGLATFWAISQVMLAAFPAFAKSTLGETNTVVIQGILACAGVGIAIGSVIAGRASRNYIETGLIPVAALGISLSIAVLPGLDSRLSMAIAFLLVGIMGGLFIVPLNAIIQFQAEESRLGTILAGNNWVQNVAMLTALGFTAAFAIAGIDSVGVLYLLTLVAVVGTGYTVRKLPHSLARIIVTGILKRRYKVDVAGFENLPRSGPTLLLGNHISWIDWALVQIACPRPVRFVMLRRIYETWYLQPFFKVFGVVPIAAGRSRDAIEAVNKLLKAGECVCLFPEGAISRNGHLGKFHSGYERMVTDLESGVIIPFYLRGLWGSSFSRAEAGLRDARAPAARRDLIVAFGKPLPMDTKAEQLKQKVFQLSISAWNSYTSNLDPIPLAFLRTARSHASAIAVVDNSTGEKLSNRQLVAAVTCCSGTLGLDRKTANVGILLPASPAAAIATLAVQLKGKVAVHINYTAGRTALQGAVENAALRQLITSRVFVTRLQARGIEVGDMIPDFVRIIFMEDIRASLPGWKPVVAAIQAAVLPANWFYRLHGKRVKIDDPAVILFSSGSESAPKGIVLSHRNIMSNARQISDVLNTRVNDVIMSCLPPFHSFGLTVTTLMPVIEGIPVVCHPNPTDSLEIAKAIAKYQATILPGTSTFLNFYARDKKVHPLMLESLRMVVSGAEKLSPQVRANFENKFKKRIFEGYGATETTPVASVNIPDAMDTIDWNIQRGSEEGSVGMPLPGTGFKVVDPDSLEERPLGEDGLVLISGNQVMLGYLNDERRTADAILELDGMRWYVSGDKGHISDAGFLVIVDRYSRCAKIAGEMVSLTRVEQAVRELLQDAEMEIAAAAVPDANRGEKIIVLVSGDLTAESLKTLIRESSIEPLLQPAEVIEVDALPKLGGGKMDLARLKNLALELSAA